MAEIGATLREARVRAGIEITEIEAATKIRTKYLRALENEDWAVLPGATYTRSFLRAYAEVVGIDPTALLEDFRLHHEPATGYEFERPVSTQPSPKAPRDRKRDGERRRAARGGRGGGIRFSPRVAILAVVFVALVVALIGLASSGGKEGEGKGSSGNVVVPVGQDTTTTTSTSTSSAERVSIQVVPAQQPVLICLIDASGRRRLDGVTLQPGADQPAYRSRQFKISIGPGGAQLIVGPKTFRVPAAGGGYLITAEGRRKLDRSAWPDCGV
jgi:cytoskeletal protein RodZ